MRRSTAVYLAAGSCIGLAWTLAVLAMALTDNELEGGRKVGYAALWLTGLAVVVLIVGLVLRDEEGK